ncbi:hypothetical protein L1987_76302 [Smallanthus sonchifolius]|uniref:Uncharacterized protein n=1 Tax=Smallanthus sonchifolius TaxID=185202 RepID=A0ACB9A765_9ASTR|nr:hypothetical protein L1987_76302 [Smallanthus sonchifolius]
MPTKPLLRLKCLSKHLISDPNILKSRSRRMIFLPSLPFHVIVDPSMVILRFPFENSQRKKITIVGSINGIILLLIKSLYDDHDMILYNPFSGDFKTIPYYPPSFDHLIAESINRTVFGFVSYEVFDFKTLSWSRAFEIGKYSLGFFSALDVEKMVFSEIVIPDDCASVRLGAYNGRLCMVCYQNLKSWNTFVISTDVQDEWYSSVLFTDSVLGFELRDSNNQEI